MLHRRRRLQVYLSLVVISVSLLYLVSRTLAPVAPVSGKSDLSECHFLLKYSYVDETDSRDLILAGARALAPYVKDDELKALSELSEERALERLETLVERTASSEPDLSAPEIVYQVMEQMVESLEDPWSVVMEPDLFGRYKESLQRQTYGGVGITLQADSGGFIIDEVYEDTPAEAAGVEVADRLIAIDGQSLEGWTLAQVVAELEGLPGSLVECRFLRGEDPFTRELERMVITVPSVDLMVVRLDDDKTLGWLTIASIKKDTASELGDHLANLREIGTDGIIIDLRDNLGGYLSEAVSVSSLFLDPGVPVVWIDRRDEADVRLSDEREKETIPMVIIVNERTASSAEIIAACLQDHGRSRVVGEKTSGKGSVQSLHEFNSGGGLKYTVARYRTPNGKRIDGLGLDPDLMMNEIEKLPFCQNYWEAVKIE